MPQNPTPLGQQIRTAREAAEMTQAELGKRVGLPRGQVEISEIERTEKHVPAWRIIEKICKVLGMT